MGICHIDLDDALLREDARLLAESFRGDVFIAQLIGAHVTRIESLLASMTKDGAIIARLHTLKDLSVD